MEIRPASVADATTIAPLLAALGYPAELGTVRERLGRIAGDDGHAGVLLAETGSEPAR